jgi:hypothetical protein
MRTICVLVGALALAGCAPEGPQASAPKSQCEAAADLIGNPYSTRGVIEFGLEVYRSKCLGMTADGSRQIKPVSSMVGPGPITAGDTDADMFRKESRQSLGQRTEGDSLKPSSRLQLPGRWRQLCMLIQNHASDALPYRMPYLPVHRMLLILL